MIYAAEIYWKDSPKQKESVLISDDEDDQLSSLDEKIFYYVKDESEIKEIMDPDIVGEWVVIKYHSTDESVEQKKIDEEAYLKVLFSHISKKVKWGNERFNIRVDMDLKYPVVQELEEGKYTLYENGNIVFEPIVPVRYINCEVTIKQPRDYE